MKVIREEEKKGPLKGIVFLNNEISFEERMRVEEQTKKTYDSWNETNKLTEEDLRNLNREAEISTAKIAGNAIKFYDYEFDITNELNEEETEWVMYYTFKSKNKMIFEMNDFEKSLSYKFKEKTVLDWIINCKKVELYTIFT